MTEKDLRCAACAHKDAGRFFKNEFDGSYEFFREYSDKICGSCNKARSTGYYYKFEQKPEEQGFQLCKTCTTRAVNSQLSFFREYPDNYFPESMQISKINSNQFCQECNLGIVECNFIFNAKRDEAKRHFKHILPLKVEK